MCVCLRARARACLCVSLGVIVCLPLFLSLSPLSLHSSRPSLVYGQSVGFKSPPLPIIRPSFPPLYRPTPPPDHLERRDRNDHSQLTAVISPSSVSVIAFRFKAHALQQEKREEETARFLTERFTQATLETTLSEALQRLWVCPTAVRAQTPS